MLAFRTADRGDIHAVFADLSSISTEEVIEDCGSWWKALPKVFELLRLPNSQTEALVDESGVALAIFGHYPGVSPTIRTTWFVFSNAFRVRGAVATLACVRRVEALQAGYPGVDFHSFTRSEHAGRIRWFSMLGFEYAGTTARGAHIYVLNAKSGDLGVGGQYNATDPQAS